MHRFFAAFDAGDDLVSLPRDEAEHLLRVLRLGVGDMVSVFDGRGHEFLARVAAAARRDVRVQLLSRLEPALESQVATVLVQAVLKGDKMDEVVRDAAMLGVSAIQPLVSRRTETTVAALRKGGRVERWRRVALASVKQSRRAVLPDVREPMTLETFLNEPSAALRLMLVEPGPGAPTDPLSIVRDLPVPADAALLVGPEGGWEPQEWTTARAHGVRLVSLGHRTLRADAVALAVLSILGFVWDGEGLTARAPIGDRAS
jgi:16S rRNA (uracil1498-N3)-methyltransferase